jgi:predicted unusual protein kinase regulating ubiquinone biosynthesis (AarF/ABC1/UbiB family)
MADKQSLFESIAWLTTAAKAQMFVRDNFIHGDLHGGNILQAGPPEEVTGWARWHTVAQEWWGAGRARMAVIDAGLVTRVEPGQAGRFRAFLGALCGGDAAALSELLVAFRDPLAAGDAPRDPARFRRDVEATVARWVGEGGRAPDGGVVSLGDLLGELLFRLQEHKVPASLRPYAARRHGCRRLGCS